MASFRAPDRSRAPALGGSDPWREARPDAHSRQMIRGARCWPRAFEGEDRQTLAPLIALSLLATVFLIYVGMGLSIGRE